MVSKVLIFVRRKPQCGVLGVGKGLLVGRSGTRIATEEKTFPLPEFSRLAPGPSQPPMQTVSCFFPTLKPVSARY